MPKVGALAYVGINANAVDGRSKYVVEVPEHEVSIDSDNPYLSMEDHHPWMIAYPLKCGSEKRPRR